MSKQEILGSRLGKPRKHILATLQNALSFNESVKSLVETLNREMATPHRITFRPVSHPAGFTRIITKRRLTIAEAYVKLVSLADADDHEMRLEALNILMHNVWRAKNLSMPLNTARVQIALMKECVKQIDDRRRQHELMSDFARASYGQAAVIRRLLKELNLIEVPETGQQLKDIGLGWDDHVHDSLTEGRKSPSHLVLDAFIKGISRITVAYYDLADHTIYEEILRAGKILGVNVEIGIEFSIGKAHERIHYMYVPPQDGSHRKLSRFFSEKAKELQNFIAGLNSNAQKRKDLVESLLEEFNRTGLIEFNEGFTEQNILSLPPLSWESVEKVTHAGQASRIHLGQILYEAMRPIMLKRVLYLKNQYRMAQASGKKERASQWEIDSILDRYKSVLRAYKQLTPAEIRKRYILSRSQFDYDSAFLDSHAVLPELKKCGGRIVFIHPLNQGPQSFIDAFCKNYRYITDIEIFNLVDSLKHDPSDQRRLSAFIGELLNGQPSGARDLLDEWRIELPPETDLQAIADHVAAKEITLRCGSDAVGWSSNIPGMGFICANQLTAQTRKYLTQNGNAILPAMAGQLLESQQEDATGDAAGIFMLAKRADSSTFNYVGDEDNIRAVGPIRFWRHLNPTLKQLILILLGFIPAVLVLDWTFALIWFAMTTSRNFVVDQISSTGIDIKRWRWRFFNLENVSNSLFWSGLSVPILMAAKLLFDELWFNIGGNEGFLFVFIKFWVIAFTNGTYLATHNTLRGFDKAAIRGNFFRSVLSWPLATLGSYGLTPLGIPDIVQAKIWSELVGGLIEGTVKYLKQYKLAKRTLEDVYQRLISDEPLTALVSRIDLLYIWAKQQQGKKALKHIMKNANPKTSLDPEQVQLINSLIYEKFSTEASMTTLSYAMLEYYDDDNLASLVDFIGNYHTPFLDWLEKNCLNKLEHTNASAEVRAIQRQAKSQ